MTICRRIALLSVAVAVTGLMSATNGCAQTFQEGEQFMSMSFGAGPATVHAPHDRWTSAAFPNGLELPRHDRTAWLFELTAGEMLSERTALLGGFDLINLDRPDISGRLQAFHFYVEGRHWIAHRVWVGGGVGPTYLEAAEGWEGDITTSGAWGLGLMGAAGVDLVQSRDSGLFDMGHASLHLQGRASTHTANHTRASAVALMLGFTYGW
jgi:hypothetical protein